MADLYAQFTRSPLGGNLAKRVGLPRPVRLERYRPEGPLIDGRVLIGGNGRLTEPVARLLSGAQAKAATFGEEARAAAGAARLDATIFNPDGAGGVRFKALVFDASSIASTGELIDLHAFFYPTAKRLESCSRVLVLGTPPTACENPAQASAQRALEGFTRSLGKEVGKGSTVQLAYVAQGAEGLIDSTLRFLLSPRSVYVSGQVIEIGPGATAPEIDWQSPLQGKTALVTGASRGIGEAIASTLARDGAHVVGLDIPAMAGELEQVTQRLGGEALQLDITAEDAPKVLAERFGDGLDVLVHNAGVTKDRTIGKMPPERWSDLMEINITSQERIDEELLARGVIKDGGRIVCLSSMNGIAGAAGQTNYATSKAAIIGRVHAMAPVLAGRGATINAVAPGFIETQMTARMPLGPREAGRRMNSLAQGGLPVDVAETIAWFASPASGGVNGNVVRVCGQSLLGA
jgi:3-oxoacyl-[acyl-carrier protein] reductase